MSLEGMSGNDIERIAKCIKGLLGIAKQAMPASFFQTDRRVKDAEKILREIRKKMNSEEGATLGE